MKIKKIHIYGFGKHENILFECDDTIALFYGKNEAGKSTIMNFIKCVLFGFPPKNSKQNAYIPRKNSTYGGRIFVTLSNGENVWIERIYKKHAVGDVRVLFDNGKEGREKELQIILQGMGSEIYKGVFHFGMPELQMLEGANGQDFTDYLLSASIIGNENIFSLERSLQKELEELYKPQGRKPLLNRKLKEYEESEKDLHSLNDLAASHIRISQQVVEKEQTLHQLSDQYEKIKGEIDTIAQEKEIYPLVEELLQSRDKLSLFTHAKHIQHGTIEKWENLKLQKRKSISELEALNVKENGWNEQLQAIHYNGFILENEQEIITLKKEYTVIKNEEEYVSGMKHTLELEEAQLQRKEQELTTIVDREMLRSKQFSFHEKRKIEELDIQFQKLQVKKEALTSQEEAVAERLLHVKQMQDECLSKLQQYKEVEHNQTLIQAYKNQNMNDVEVELRKEIEREKKNKQKMVTAFLFVTSFFILLCSVWAFIAEKSVLFYGSFLIFASVAFGGYMYARRLRRHTKENSKRSEFEFENKTVTVEQYEQSKKYLLEYELLEKQAKELSLQLSNIDWENDRVIDKFEEWEQQYFSLIEEREKFLPDCIDKSIYTNFSLMECVKEIESYQQNYEKVLKKNKEIQIHTNQKENILQKIGEIAHGMNISEEVTFTFVDILANELVLQKENVVTKAHIEKQVEEIVSECISKKLEIESIECELQTILNEAKVENEEQLYKICSDFEQYKLAKIEREFIEKKLQHYEKHAQSIERDGLLETKKRWRDQEAMFETIHTEMQHTKEHISHNLGRKKEIEALLSTELLEEKLEVIKNEIKETFSTYMTLKISLQSLQSVIDEYKQHLLPTMLQTIESYFKLFTGGHYISVYFQNEQIVVEDWHNERFVPEELSQATKEQLYLSVRFALAIHLPFTEKFPIIIDDAFVNFDNERINYVTDAIKEVSKTHQIIFFTCHQSYESMIKNKNKTIQLVN